MTLRITDDASYDAFFSDDYMMRPRGETVDETHGRVLARLQRILDPHTGVRLPPGLTVKEFSEYQFTPTVDVWKVPWLKHGQPADRTESACEWPSEWTGELHAAAADPYVDDRAVARLVVAEVVAAAAAALMHEVIEWAALDNRRLWDAHGVGPHVASKHGERAFLDHVNICQRPTEVD